jgi:hypothetical protein
MNRGLSAAIAAAGLLAAGAARGETLDVTWTYTAAGGAVHTEATWLQDSAPTPFFHLAGDGTSVPVSDFVSTTFPPRSDVAYYLQSGPSSGMMFSTSFGGGIVLLGSQQIFTGTVEAPVFAPGSFTGMIEFDSGGEFPSTLTFTVVPEPSTWTMMILGFAGLALVAKARRRPMRP